MLNQGIYGAGIGYDTKANMPVGPDRQKMAIKFKASTTSVLNSVRFVQRGGTGYSLGTGGTLVISVQPDNGSGAPSGTKMAHQSYVPGNPSGTWEKYDAVSFPTPPTLTAGTLYYIVFENANTTNYISVNSTLVYGGARLSPHQPAYLDAEYGLLHTTGAWAGIDGAYTPVVDLAYANGAHDGSSYFEAMIANYGTISGTARMVREHFTVSGGDRKVGSASVRLRRTGGTSPLAITLQTAAGMAVESVTVPAASVPVSAPGGDTGGAVWVTASFSSAHVLSNGGAYNLRLSTAAGTTYTAFPVRSGLSKGFKSYIFSGGSGQSTTNGSTWSDLYAWDHEDLQFYFTSSTAAPTKTPTRIAGVDRYATAIAASRQAYPTQGSAGGVVLARGDNYPDALVAAPLAKAHNAPLLLTAGTTLPAAVAAEIRRVLPAGGTVYLLGGGAAIPAGVESQLTGLGYTPVRYAGADRFATALSVADALGNPSTVLLATGANFPDALAAGPAAAHLHGAVLLTNGSALPAGDSAYLRSHPGRVYAIGGPAAAAVPSATAVVGADRYATAARVATSFFTAPTVVGVAAGTGFPDALSGSALLAGRDAPLLLSAAASLPSPSTSYLTAVKSSATTSYLFGGTTALQPAVATQVAAALS